MKNLGLITLISAIIMLNSCTKDKVTVALDSNCMDTISFAHQIKPMIDQNCSTSGCHDANSQASGYNFTTHASVAANATKILQTISGGSGVVAMPLGADMLPDSLIQQFNCWSNQGKLNN